jgi:hypothetical protein
MRRTVLGVAPGPEGTVQKVGTILAASSLLVVVGNEICQNDKVPRCSLFSLLMSHSLKLVD